MAAVEVTQHLEHNDNIFNPETEAQARSPTPNPHSIVISCSTTCHSSQSQSHGAPCPHPSRETGSTAFCSSPSRMAHAERTPPEPKLLNIAPPRPMSSQCTPSPPQFRRPNVRTETRKVFANHNVPIWTLASDCASGASRRYEPTLLKTCPPSRHSVLRTENFPYPKPKIPITLPPTITCVRTVGIRPTNHNPQILIALASD
jgi:hypothetical protein